MNYSAADPKFVADLAALLPPDSLRIPEPRYLEESRGRFLGGGGVLALSRSVDEVSIIMRTCHAAGVPVVPYGGGTGLVGGQIMPGRAQPVILSLERMSAIRSINGASNVIVAEAGCILADVQAAADAEGRLFPLSLAAQGTARIGGNLSTNAGGLNVLRYGNARDLCLGLEVVLPNGEIWHGLSELRKDNTGYDLKNLMIGAEGTLGVITAASLKLFSKPVAHETAFLVVPDPEAAIGLLALARAQLGEAVSAFELIHSRSLEFLSEAFPDLRQPFEERPEWSVLMEVGLSKALVGQDVLEVLFGEALERELVTDGVVASSEGQRQAFWSLRETIPAANKIVGSISSHDVSIPIERIPAFIEKGTQAVAAFEGLRVNCFGHLGDGNLHFNVFPPAGENKSNYSHLQREVKVAVHDVVHEFGGSFSAEHGVGRLKVDDLARYGDPVKLAMMRAIKDTIDPKGIMNPGAMFSK